MKTKRDGTPKTPIRDNQKIPNLRVAPAVDRAFTARDASGKVLLWIRSIDSLTAQPLAGTDDASFPFWSPDSLFVAYVAQQKLLKIASSGA